MIVNKLGADWLAIKAWCADAIADATLVVVSRGIDERSADTLRGRIAALNDLIDSVEPSVTPEVEEINYG